MLQTMHARRSVGRPASMSAVMLVIRLPKESISMTAPSIRAWLCARLGPIERRQPLQRRAKPVGIEPQGQPRRHRRHDVAAVERRRNVLQPIGRLAEANELLRRRPRRQPAQQSVVGGDELLLADPRVDDRPVGAHARIDHRHVDRLGREPVGHVVQQQGRAADVLRRNVVGDVDDRRRRDESTESPLSSPPRSGCPCRSRWSG